LIQPDSDRVKGITASRASLTVASIPGFALNVAITVTLSWAMGDLLLLVTVYPIVGKE
jgi:hypothetical protein